MNAVSVNIILAGPSGAYAGIGARSTPRDILELMQRIAQRLCQMGWILRTGGAPGADTAFECGALEAGTCARGRIELYLPWAGFEGRRGEHVRLARPSAAASLLAKQHHPRWFYVTQQGRLLLARNVHQVLGADCRSPVRSPARFVLCWTPDGATTAEETSPGTGGTGQVIRIASAYNIPVFNLKRDEHLAAWRQWSAEGTCT